MSSAEAPARMSISAAEEELAAAGEPPPRATEAEPPANSPSHDYLSLWTSRPSESSEYATEGAQPWDRRRFVIGVGAAACLLIGITVGAMWTTEDTSSPVQEADTVAAVELDGDTETTENEGIRAAGTPTGAAPVVERAEESGEAPEVTAPRPSLEPNVAPDVPTPPSAVVSSSQDIAVPVDPASKPIEPTETNAAAVAELRPEIPDIATPVPTQVAIDEPQRAAAPPVLATSTIGSANLASATVTPARQASVPSWLAIASAARMDIVVDGETLGTTDDDRLPLAPGSHQVVVTNDQLGYRNTFTLELKPGEEIAYTLNLPNGRLRVDGPTGTKVWVDGELVGQTPLENVPTQIGIHEIIAQHPDLGIWHEQVVVGTDTTGSITLDGSRARQPESENDVATSDGSRD